MDEQRKLASRARDEPDQPVAEDNGDEDGRNQRTAQPGNAIPSLSRSRRHDKIFNCPIHRTIRIAPQLLDFIDTPPFQRLRELHQLGLTHYVFYGATHKRFEHSIGVCVEAHNMADHIWTSQRRQQGRPREETVDICERDKLVVQLAGLCHDLGHGPFSHVFESEFLSAKEVTNWKHEEMSCKLMRHIVDTNYIDSFLPEEVELAQSLIKGDRSKAPMEKGFLFDIVANQRNGLDVDKADYLVRDAHYCGVKVSHDWDRLVKLSKVIDNQICFKNSEYSNIQELFHTREKMHREVYTHRKVRAINFMVVDALLEVDEALGISSKIHSPETFLKLNDTLLTLIEHYDAFNLLPSQRAALKRSENLLGEVAQAALDGLDQGLRAAQGIVQRLRSRQLYRYCNEVPIPPESQETFKLPSPTDLCSYWSPDGVTQLLPKDVIVCLNKINYGLQEENPLDHVGFFCHPDDTQIMRLRPHQLGSMHLQAYQDVHMRVYCRDADERKCAALEVALENFARDRFGSKVSIATPLKNRGGLHCSGTSTVQHWPNRGDGSLQALGQPGKTSIVQEYKQGPTLLPLGPIPEELTKRDGEQGFSQGSYGCQEESRGWEGCQGVGETEGGRELEEVGGEESDVGEEGGDGVGELHRAQVRGGTKKKRRRSLIEDMEEVGAG